MPHITTIDTPLYRDLELYSHTLLPEEVYLQLGQVLGVNVNSELALLSTLSVDCNGNAAPGVAVQLNADNPGVSYVVDQGIPSINERVSLRDGSVGYANAPPGLFRVSGSAPDGTLFDRQGVVLRARTHTVTYLGPQVWSVPQLCGLDGSRPAPGTTQASGALRVCEAAER